MKNNPKRVWFFITLAFLCIWLSAYFFFIYKDLPRTYSLDDYKPPLITTVLDRKGVKIGEFFKERRILTPPQAFPESLIEAFVSAEDGNFFDHKGVNLPSIFRAFIANIKAGKKVQGGSTITQQAARALLLSSKKTYTRKLQEIILARRMEKHLSKKEILYLYLNQIYLGHGAYGVGMASRIYFKKDVKDLTLEESALLAGLPRAPSRFSPISNAKKAKERQIYVLSRMAAEGYISEEQKEESLKKPLKVYMRENYSMAPYFVETLRQILSQKIGEDQLLKGGLTLHSSLDLEMQKEAKAQLKKGLEDLDKRQGWRGPIENLSSKSEIEEFFIKREKKWIQEKKSHRILSENGDDLVLDEDYKKIEFGEWSQGLIEEVKPEQAQVRLMFSMKGVIPLEGARWARKPDKKAHYKWSEIDSLSEALKKGDVVWIKRMDPEEFKNLASKVPELLKKDFFLLSLEQEPKVQGALIAFDQKQGGITAMAGGYDFLKSQFNRSYQAQRQTGSVFKPIIYASALDKGFTANSVISDAPVVYEDEEADLFLKAQRKIRRKAQDLLSQNEDGKEEGETQDPEEEKDIWKPMNYSKKFTGDILFRTALIRSLNIPTVKLIEKIGIPWIEFYARRLGLTSSMNTDYTLALGSSSVSLYEMTKAFSIFAGGGRRLRPLLITKALDIEENIVLENLSLDEKLKEKLGPLEAEFEQSRLEYWENHEEGEDSDSNIFFKDKEQIISEQTAYLMTSLLQGVIEDPAGTGYSAHTIKHPLAGKTGTTNGYIDAWFIGYSAEITTGVWMGFDNQESLGQGETGSRAALPVWKNFMKNILKEKEPVEFEIPPSIVFAQIDSKTGFLAQAETKNIVKQAFIEGSEPKEEEEDNTAESEDQKFLREDLAL